VESTNICCNCNAVVALVIVAVIAVDVALLAPVHSVSAVVIFKSGKDDTFVNVEL
jgi:hypothetical protein